MAIYRAEIDSAEGSRERQGKGDYDGELRQDVEDRDENEVDDAESIENTQSETLKYLHEMQNEDVKDLQGWELKKLNEACKAVLNGQVPSQLSDRSIARRVMADIRNEWNRRNELAKSDPAKARKEAEARDEISERTGKPKKAPRGAPFKKGEDKRRAQSQNGEADGEGEGEGDSDDSSDSESENDPANESNDSNNEGESKMQDMKQQLPKESSEDKDGALEGIIRRIAREEDYKVVTAVDANFMALSKEIAKIAKMARSGGTGNKTIILDKHQDIRIEIDGELHEAVHRVLQAVRAGFRNIWIAGPAGCGKSKLASQVAKILGDLGITNGDYWEQSMSVGATESLFFGRSLPFGEHGQFEFAETDWIRIYENGGVTLLDECDGADANMLLSLNGPIENGRMSLPARRGNTMAYRHKNHVLIGAANTWGHGSTRDYAGRNQLDAAFLSRFEGAEFDVDFDRDLEARLCEDKELLHEIWRIRDTMRAIGIRRKWGSTRTIVRAKLWRASGMSVKATVRTMLGGSWSNDDLAKIGYDGPKPKGAL